MFGGHEHRLRQTVIALRAGEELSEHENPGEAMLQVLQGRVLLRAGEVPWNGSVGDLMTVPDGIHSLDAVEDSVSFSLLSRSAEEASTQASSPHARRR